MLAVTTIHEQGWREYGHRMVETFLKHWPDDVSLMLYNEGFVAPVYERVIPCEFPEWFPKWKEKHARNDAAHGLDVRVNRRGRAYDYRYDCVRFSHKIAAITDSAADIWIDADVVTHRRVTHDWLDRFAPRGEDYLAWLDRRNKYPECGFLMFNTRNDRHLEFMRLLRKTYESDDVFNYKETHDSYIIEQSINQCVRRWWFRPPLSLSGSARNTSNPFDLGPLGECMKHLKGQLKHENRRENLASR
jgi:hypothetical protein